MRLLTAPGVGLPTALDVERLAARVRTVVTVSTPHHGTPIASFFTTLQGQQLMQLLSLSTIYVLNFGHLPLAALLWMGSFFVRFGGLVAGSELLDELFGKLLEDFTPARRRAVRKLLRDVVRDQALMLQLTPEAMEVFNASVLQRPGIRYGAVVGQAAPPSLRATLHAGIDPAAQVTHALYSALYRLIAAAPVRVSPQLAPAQARALRRAYRAMPSPAANDGIVPTLSQAWGQVIHAAVADHLDVLGHFRDADARSSPRRLARFRERLRPPALRGALDRRGALPGARRDEPAEAPASGRPRPGEEGAEPEEGATALRRGRLSERVRTLLDRLVRRGRFVDTGRRCSSGWRRMRPAVGRAPWRR